MSDQSLRQQIVDLIDGTISDTRHDALQERLKSDAAARRLFRELMDVEAGLRTWSADEGYSGNATLAGNRPSSRRRSWRLAMISTAVSLLAVAVWWTQRPDRDRFEQVEQRHPAAPPVSVPGESFLGRVVQRGDGVLQPTPSLQQGRFTAGTIRLASGAAELRFDSGTNVILEGPCELTVEAAHTARLLTGTVCVDVTEVSNGFVLETPEARIIDEGTQYAVVLDEEATEVHVFDGSVIWIPTDPVSGSEDRITSGEAHRFLRREPGRPHRIPFGQRQFVRRLEESVRQAAGGELIAYDGFENLAGRLRRGRSGFGWSGGWESARRGRGPLAEVIDAPDNIVFGMERSGRRLLALRGGDRIRRSFENPVALAPGTTLFISVLVRPRTPSVEADASVRIVLEPDSASPRYIRRHSVSFGVTSLGQPFLNNAGTVCETALPVPAGKTCLFIFRYLVDRRGSTSDLQIYRPDEPLDQREPDTWTESCHSSDSSPGFVAVRLTAGASRDWLVDELKVGTTWSSIVPSAEPRTERQQPAGALLVPDQ
ncbi:FecR protein [Maioricimonas rarisocia]|uniref:FecR protein n=1 Tax=Maioricimonas rarisocia TaxID=2528026 RepID=A0A517Z6U4_9PLAN|nr:FecR domain-containing protein [Maioricimonas rarisocia]QDU38210.1 FecR protein [Maioricimonas rarisocia]